MTPPDRRDDALLERLDRVQTLLDQIGPAVLGHRIKRLREQQSLSIRDVSGKASISKNSLVRLEQGGGTQPVTVLKVCSVLGIHIERLAQTSGEDLDLARPHRSSDDRWVDGADMGSGPLLGADRPLTIEERQRAVDAGAHTPVNLLACRLPGGRVLPSILEVHQPTAPKSHVGEEFAYVLEGRAVITVGSQRHILNAGESVTFWSAEPHTYAPAEDAALPVRILSVRIDG